MNKKFFLNKKFYLYLFYIILIFVLLFFIYQSFFVKNKKIQIAEKINSDIRKKVSLDRLEEKDTDGDGLKDWEEVLYGTDSELVDTDGDGINDFNEIEKGLDPLSWGPGEKKEIRKIINKKKNVLTLAEQKRQFQVSYQKELERKKFLEEISKKTELSEREKEILTEENKRKKEMKEDLNKSAIVLSSNLYKPSNHNFLIENLFLYFIPSNKENGNEILEEYKDLLSENNIKDYQDFDGDEKDEIKKIISSYKKIGNLLQNLSLKNEDIKRQITILGDTFLNLGESLNKTLKKVEEKDRIQDQSFFEKYHLAVRLNTLSFRNINKMIVLNDLKFADNEAGKLFVYSL